MKNKTIVALLLCLLWGFGLSMSESWGFSITSPLPKPRTEAGSIVQVGLQPFANSRQYHEVALDAGITVISSGECRRLGIDAVVERALVHLAEHCDAIYVDFDIDVLDRAFAPACPGARPGGIDPAELRSAARLCGEHPKVRIADLVEVDPECDVARVTVYATCMCLLGFASGVARRKQL